MEGDRSMEISTESLCYKLNSMERECESSVFRYKEDNFVMDSDKAMRWHYITELR